MQILGDIADATQMEQILKKQIATQAERTCQVI